MNESSTPRALPDGALEGVTLSCGYTVGEKLGKGGMAWVYEATKDEQRVALKILFSHMADDEEFNARFLREARIQQALDHPSIVSVTDIIEERGLVGFALEYCNDGTLLDLLKELRGPMPFWQIKALFLPLLDAMGYAHEQGVIHRDLKPPNILLHREGDVVLPKLTDFGIAKLFGDATLTQTGTMIGTLLYMSPEQVEESKYVDARADIYSLGVLLYQLASGTLPFIGKSSALMMQILNDPAPRPHTMTPLADVIMRCLAKDPAERYQSCEELSAAVSTALALCMDAQNPEAVGPLPTGEPDTTSMQGSAGVKPGGSDTIEDLDAVATAQTQMLTPGDIASERNQSGGEEEAHPEGTEGVADDTASEAVPFGLQATVDAAAFVSAPPSHLAPGAEEEQEEAAQGPQAPQVTNLAEEGPPLVPLTLVEPDVKGLSAQGKQSVLLALVALGLALIVVVLWMGRTQHTRPALVPRARPAQPLALRRAAPKRTTKRRQVPRPIARKPLPFKMVRRPATPPVASSALGLDSSVAGQNNAVRAAMHPPADTGPIS